MYSFKNDYSEGAHPKILEALAEASKVQNEPYGNDYHSLRAAELIREKTACKDADVHFLSGGTQTNLTAISSFLRLHEATVCTDTGHINVHEAGSIEATGHKVLTAPSPDGKLAPELVDTVLQIHVDEHMVKPKLVYISNSTEVGTIYSKSELTSLSHYCKEKNLYLFLDGARLGSALTAEGADLTLQDIAGLTDAFYIGGTKNGALLGEALVITNKALKEDFRYCLKQKGAMLAKSMLLGIQFEELFQNDLYFELAKHANIAAKRLRDVMTEAGVKFLSFSPTNQLFPILSNSTIKSLHEAYDFEIWRKISGGETAIRLVTSWATPDHAINDFIRDFKDHLKII